MRSNQPRAPAPFSLAQAPEKPRAHHQARPYPGHQKGLAPPNAGVPSPQGRPRNEERIGHLIGEVVEVGTGLHLPFPLREESCAITRNWQVSNPFFHLDTDTRSGLLKHARVGPHIDENAGPPAAASLLTAGRIVTGAGKSSRRRGPHFLPMHRWQALRGIPGAPESSNAADFGDLLLEVLRIFHPTRRAEIYQSRFKYSWSMISGYQRAQYSGWRLLAHGHKNSSAWAMMTIHLWLARAEVDNIRLFRSISPAAK